MKVKDEWGFSGTIEEALSEEISGCLVEYGQFETVAEKVNRLEKLLVRFVASKITTVTELNALAGYDKYSEGTE